MNLVERARNVCLSPTAAWTAIDSEGADAPTLITHYVLPLAGVAAVAQLIGQVVVGQSFGFATYRMPIGTALGAAVASVIVAAVGVIVLSFIIDALAPSFGATKSRQQALKVAVYSATPVWLAGVLQIVPVLGLLVLAGSVVACAVAIALIGGTLIGRLGVQAATGFPE